MNSEEVTSIAVKVLALYLLVNMVTYFPSIVLMLSAEQSDDLSNSVMPLGVIIVISFVLMAVVVSFLMFKLANSIVSSTPDKTESASPISQVFILQVVGLYFIVDALICLPGICASIFRPASDKHYYLHALGPLFEIALGLYLVIKPEVWSDWLLKLRGRG